MIAGKPVPLDFTNPHVLRNHTEYDRAIAELDALVDQNPAPGSREYDRLEFLSLLAGAYEEARFPVGEITSPQRAVDFFLEQHGRTRAELARLFGGRSRVSDFFKGKRRLSLAQISALVTELGIPADLLIDRSKRPTAATRTAAVAAAKAAMARTKGAAGTKKRAVG